MTARVIRPDPHIDAVRGCVAIERGPEVLCLESTDLDVEPGRYSVNDAALRGVTPTEHDGRVLVRVEMRPGAGGTWPYGDGAVEEAGDREVSLVPYNRWANRGPSTMRVWLPVA